MANITIDDPTRTDHYDNHPAWPVIRSALSKQLGSPSEPAEEDIMKQRMANETIAELKNFSVDIKFVTPSAYHRPFQTDRKKVMQPINPEKFKNGKATFTNPSSMWEKSVQNSLSNHKSKAILIFNMIKPTQSITLLKS